MFRHAVALAAVAAALTHAAPAVAATCTVTPGATFTLEATFAASTISPQLITDGPNLTLAYTIGASPEAGASCSNMTVGSSGEFFHTANPSASRPWTGGDSDTNSIPHKGIKGGSYSAKVTTGCQCGILGGPSKDTGVGPAVVPPWFQIKPTALLGKLVNQGSQVQLDHLPANTLITLLAPLPQLELCTGETAKVQLTNTKTGTFEATLTGKANCDGYEGLNTIEFTTPASGTLELSATFLGAKGNVVTLTVDPSASGTSSSSSSTGGDGSDDTSDTTASCSTVPGSMLAGLFISLAAFKRRRS